VSMNRLSVLFSCGAVLGRCLHFTLSITLALLAGGLANAQPDTSFAFNDAWWRAGAAQGSVFKLGAWGIGAPRVAHVARGFPLPRELGGFSVQITVGETTTQAIMLSATPWEGSTFSPGSSFIWDAVPGPPDYWIIQAVLPSDTPLGSRQVSVTYNGRRSVPKPIGVWRRSFGLYRAGPYQATASNINSERNWTTNTFTNPARPAQYVVLWGTGLGAVPGDEAAGPLPGDLNVSGLEVLVGGRRARVLYAGRSGCCAGIDQIVFETPAGIEGCHVPVVVAFPGDGPASNYVAVSIASGTGECSDPHGWPVSVLEKMRIEGSVNYGQIGPGLATFSQVFGFAIPPLGTCSAVDLGEPVVGRLALDNNFGYAGPAISFSELLGPVRGPVKSLHPFDAGPAVNFNTPQGLVRMPKNRPGAYGGMTTVPVSGPGEYSIDNGPGGDDIGPFHTTFTVLPSDFTRTYQGINSEGLLVTWSGAGQAGGYVVMRGVVGYSGDIGVGFVCVEQADKGTFFIPPDVVNFRWRFQYLDVRHENVHRFSVPGLDLAEFVYDAGSR